MMALQALSVVVVTYERLPFLLRCLDGLRSERGDILDLVVVDASKNSAEEPVRRLSLDVTYVHAPELAGWMTRSRNRGLLHVAGDIVAFLDDDVVVRRGWATALRRVYASSGADAVVGRTCNGIAGEEQYEQPLGRLLPDGRLTAGFAAHRDQVVDVDHGIGANMSFTRQVVEKLGGFRDDYPGTALREDTDMFLRVKRLGGRAVFAPDAVVDHLPAPHVHGRRFDTRYKLYGRRNHMVLLTRYAGAGAPMLRRWVAGQFTDVLRAGGVRRRTERLGVVVAGLTFGAVAVARDGGWGPMDPRRSGPHADEIRSKLAGGGAYV